MHIKPSQILTALLVNAMVAAATAPGFASSIADKPMAGASFQQAADEFSSSSRGRRNTAIVLGATAGILGALAIGAGAYPYPYYGYYGPAYPYYGPPAVYVRPRAVRCWVHDPYRGGGYWTTCYR